jgi:hypothetical protein
MSLLPNSYGGSKHIFAHEKSFATPELKQLLYSGNPVPRSFEKLGFKLSKREDSFSVQSCYTEGEYHTDVELKEL